MVSTSETLFWKKKEFASFILSVLVFFIHISSFAQYGNTDGFISTFNERISFLFRESITRFAVPMFFILSGISFFRGYENSKYLNKIRSRMFTLAIPYLLWNTIWMIFDIVCSYTFLSKYFVGRQLFVLSVTNVLKGIFFYEHNIPFWFVFDLIIFSLAAPLLHLIVRNKYIGIASISLLTILATFGIGIPSSIFYSSTAIIFYLIGAIIGEHYFDFASRKANKGIRCFSIIFLLAYITLKNFFPSQQYPFKVLSQVVIFTLSAFALWSTIDMFIDKVKPKMFYSRSFAIYAMHINVSAIIAKLTFLCLPKSGWMAVPNFIITTILTLFLINFICSFLEKNLPKVYSILMGNRLKYHKKT